MMQRGAAMCSGVNWTAQLPTQTDLNITSDMEELRASEHKRMMQRGAAMCSGVNWTAQLPTQTDLNIAHVMEMELRAIRAYADGDKTEAFVWMQKACDLEDATAFMFGPPTVVKPSHELYAEWLYENGDYEEARAHALKALEKTPGRLKVVSLQTELDKSRSSL